MDRKREEEGGRMQCFMKKENESLIDVENVETTGKGTKKKQKKKRKWTMQLLSG